MACLRARVFCLLYVHSMLTRLVCSHALRACGLACLACFTCSCAWRAYMLGMLHVMACLACFKKLAHLACYIK